MQLVFVFREPGLETLVQMEFMNTVLCKKWTVECFFNSLEIIYRQLICTAL